MGFAEADIGLFTLNARPASGRWLQIAGGRVDSTATITNNQQHWAPIVIPVACTLDRIGLNVTVIGAGTGGGGTVVIRLGIYRDTGATFPGTVLLDAGTIDATSATNQTITINQALSAGIYWLSACAQGCDTTAPTVTKATGSVPGIAALTQPVASGQSAYVQSAITGAFATAAPTGSLAGMPFVYLRAA